jgi:cell division protein FtsB
MASRRTLLVIGAAVAAALAGFSMADGEGFRRYLRLSGEVRSLEARNAALRTENTLLVHEIQSLRSEPAALERAAREELGFIAPGEVVMVLE